MKKIFIKNSFLIIISLFSLIRCAAKPTYQQLNPDEKVAKINIGDSETNVAALWKEAAEENNETYGSKVFRVLNYTGSDGRPEAFFSIDPISKKVAGKALWIYSNDSNPNLDTNLKARFKNVQWQTFTPCHTHSDKDKILVNREQGLSIDIGGNGLGVISWSTPDLLSNRIDLIMKTCAKLQNFTK